jgi:MYXO-CTERM domain-containing protein
MRLWCILGALLFAFGCDSSDAALKGAEASNGAGSEFASPNLQIAMVQQADTAGSVTGLVPTDDDFDNGSVRYGGIAPTSSMCIGWAGQCNVVPTGGSRFRAMNVKFAMPSLPACAVVTGATLTFHDTGCETCQNSGTVTLYRIGTAWSEAQLTGSCSGTANASAPASVGGLVPTATSTASGLASGAFGSFSFSVGSDVQAWLNGTANNGWQLQFSVNPISIASCSTCSSNGGCGGNKKTIFTREDATNHPTLDITYTLKDANCDDGKPCTADACTMSGCTHTANDALTCSDGKACTTDTCSGGNCVSTPVNTACDDHNVCTNDTCSPSSPGADGAGCIYANNTNTCTDSAACTQNDKCVNGVCVGTPNNALCDDQNACTTDTCTASGCQNTISMPGCQTCTTDAQCPTGKFCNGQTCIPASSNGTTCTAPSHCATGNCVDGVCCDLACNGQCQACNVQGSVGVCKAVSGKPVAPRAACTTDGTACAGSCNGVVTATCTYPSTTTRCRAPSCAANVATLAAACNGTGKCPAVQTQACAPFVCGPTQCVAMCTTNAECQAGRYCAGGMCVPLIEAGKTCASDGQCKSGICSDKLCCNARCSGQCEACDVQGSEGICTPVPSGAPHGNRPACVTDGTACDGHCDATTPDACVYPGPGTQCSDPSCSSGVATVASYCQGTGKCPTAERVTCGNACVGDLCGNDCATDTACSLGEFCQAGKCRKQHRNGEACNAPGECASSYCVDGYCCDEACIGQCQACDVASSPGTCTAVTGPPHGVRPPCASVDPECGGACDGVKATGCTYPSTETVCTAASCATGVAKLAQTCAGDGSCGPLQEQLCAPQVCSGIRCGGGCTTDANCGTGKYCSAGVCVAKLPPGTPCGASTQCGSGFCIDGVCCDKACGEQCEACNDPSNVGRCVPVTGSPHGGRTPCIGTAACAGQCDGNLVTACVLPSADTLCGKAVCTEGVTHDTPKCNGAGTCIAGNATDCYPFGCGSDGKSCSSSCASDSDCASGLLCRNGGCVLPPDAGRPPVDSGAGGVSPSSDASAAGATSATGGSSGKAGSGGQGGKLGAGGSAGNGSGIAGASPVIDGGFVEAGTDAGHAKPRPHSNDSGSCGCRIGGTSDEGGNAAAALLLACLLVRRRRGKGPSQPHEPV